MKARLPQGMGGGAGNMQNMIRQAQKMQEAMEKSLAFNKACDSLLVAAEYELLAPVKAQLDRAIRAVGLERGYECIVNRAVEGLLVYVLINSLVNVVACLR